MSFRRRCDPLVIYYISVFTSGGFSLLVEQSVRPSLVVLGYPFTLQCSFTRNSTKEVLQQVSLARKRSGDRTFIDIFTFPHPAAHQVPVAVLDKTLETRTITKGPDSSISTSEISVRFKEAICSDIAVYKWTISYHSEQNKTEEKTSKVTSKMFLQYFCYQLFNRQIHIFDKYIILSPYKKSS